MKKLLFAFFMVLGSLLFAEELVWRAFFDAGYTEKDAGEFSSGDIIIEDGKLVEYNGCFIELSKYAGKYQPLKGRAIVCSTIKSDKDCVAQFRVSAYWYYSLFVNGKKVFDTVPQAGKLPPSGETFERVAIPLKKGENNIAVLVNSGYGTFRFSFNRLPDPASWPADRKEREKWFKLLFAEPSKLIRQPWVINQDVDSVRIGAEFNNDSVCGVRYFRKGDEKNAKDMWTAAYGHRSRKKAHLFEIKGLEADSEYCFEILRLDETEGKNIVDYKGTFRTNPDKGIKQTFVAIGDTQITLKNRIKLVNNLFKNCFAGEADMIFALGDIADAYDDFGYAFFDTYFDAYAANKKDVAHYMVRGNHEYRGVEAPKFTEYLGRSYYAFRRGDVFYIVLDVGEDKPFTASERHAYTWFIDTDEYFNEQTEWLEKVINSEECKNAKRRIVLAHCPPFEFEEKYFYSNNYRFYKFFFGEKPQCKIDLWLSGHTHTPYRFDPQTNELFGAEPAKDSKERSLTVEDFKNIRFPVYVIDGPGGGGVQTSVTFVTVDEKGISLRTTTPGGRIVDEVTFPYDAPAVTHKTTYIEY